VSLADLSSLGSFISAVAVLVSLVYLALQIRQNTKHSRALIQQGRAARIADTALRLAELRADVGLNSCFDGAVAASPQDISRFLMAARAVFISAEDSFFQAEEGLLGAIAFESFKSSVRAGMGASGLAAAWLLTRDMYEPKFRAFMDELNGDFQGTGTHLSAAAWRGALASLAARSNAAAPASA
jgi:hypothetical protein